MNQIRRCLHAVGFVGVGMAIGWLFYGCCREPPGEVMDWFSLGT
jgi:hypothetical protein